jgi:predicted NBD/HSP70 family sugar kinase
MSNYTTGSAAFTRDLNRAAILRLIAFAGPIARTNIARRLGLSPATVTSVTRELLDQGLLRVAERAPSNGGRPALLLELVAAAATAFGVKVAPDRLVGVRMNLDADVLERFEEPLDCTAAEGPRRIGETLARWLSGSGEHPPLMGVGLGVPGIADPVAETVTSPMMRWNDLPLAALVREHVGVAVLVDNDVNTLAVAERLYGRGRNVDHFLTVTIGRGIGLGIVLAGNLHHGYAGGAGEFGHIVVAEGGPRCSCGKYGCLEAVAADPALVAAARKLGVIPARAGIERLRRAADEGNESARALFAEAATTLGQAVANLVNVLSPQVVLLSGEGTQAWPHMAHAFDGALRANIFPALAGVVVEVDPWDDAKWAIGAASLVLRSTFAPPLAAASADSSSLLPRLPHATEAIA